MTKKLTFKKAKALALREVEATPNFTYVYPPSGKCSYVHHTTRGGGTVIPNEPDDIKDTKKTPGCLIGRVLIDLGLPIDEVAKLDLIEESAIDDLIDNGDLSTFGVDVTPKAAIFLSKLQREQDQGRDWRNAYLAALDAVPSE